MFKNMDAENTLVIPDESMRAGPQPVRHLAAEGTIARLCGNR